MYEIDTNAFLQIVRALMGSRVRDDPPRGFWWRFIDQSCPTRFEPRHGLPHLGDRIRRTAALHRSKHQVPPPPISPHPSPPFTCFREASFVAIDCEFTGLKDQKSQTPKPQGRKQTIEERYKDVMAHKVSPPTSRWLIKERRIRHHPTRPLPRVVG